MNIYLDRKILVGNIYKELVVSGSTNTVVTNQEIDFCLNKCKGLRYLRFIDVDLRIKENLQLLLDIIKSTSINCCISFSNCNIVSCNKALKSMIKMDSKFIFFQNIDLCSVIYLDIFAAILGKVESTRELSFLSCNFDDYAAKIVSKIIINNNIKELSIVEHKSIDNNLYHLVDCKGLNSLSITAFGGMDTYSVNAFATYFMSSSLSNIINLDFDITNDDADIEEIKYIASKVTSATIDNNIKKNHFSLGSVGNGILFTLHKNKNFNNFADVIVNTQDKPIDLQPYLKA